MSTAGVAVLLLLGACGRGGDAGSGLPGPITVLAAADLQFALPEIASRFESATGHTVRLAFGSTGNLTTQIEQGAPGDVFLAANEQFIDRLIRGDHADADTRFVYGVGRIVLTWASGVAPPGRLEELREARFRAVAVANPEHAPYGQAAREALDASGVWAAVQPRLVLGENVSQAFQFVRSGNAEVGIVALGVVLGVRDAEFLLLDADLHRPLRQAGAVLAQAEQPELASLFLTFMGSTEAQSILRRYGFESP